MPRRARGCCPAAPDAPRCPSQVSYSAPYLSTRDKNDFFLNHHRVWGGERSNVVLLLWEAWHSLLKGHFEERASSSALNGSELPLSLLDHDLYPDVVLRALSVLVPDLQQYWNGAAGVKFPKPAVDGGYYTRTPENLPLIGAHFISPSLLQKLSES